MLKRFVYLGALVCVSVGLVSVASANNPLSSQGSLSTEPTSVQSSVAQGSNHSSDVDSVNTSAVQSAPTDGSDAATDLSVSSNNLSAMNQAVRQQLQTQIQSLQSQNQALNQQIKALYNQLDLLKHGDAMASGANNTMVQTDWFSSMRSYVLARPIVVLSGGLALVLLLCVFYNIFIGSKYNKAMEANMDEPSADLNTDDHDIKEEYDFLGSEEGWQSKLNLARAYLAMDEVERAMGVLKEIKSKGDSELVQQADALMAEHEPQQ